MNKSQAKIFETLAAIESISAELHKMSIRLQEIETKLYTTQKKIYQQIIEPQKGN